MLANLSVINLLHTKINSKLFFVVSILGFFLSIIVGTISHEFGHIIVAKLLGYKTILHYDSMNWTKNGQDMEESAPIIHRILVNIGGVLTTVFIGTISFIYINKLQARNTLAYFCALFFCLFWMRPIVNFGFGVMNYILQNGNLFGGDELQLSLLLNLPAGFFSILFAILAAFVCGYTFFFIVPNSQKIQFILAGCIGGIGGYIIWFIFLGKILLP